MIATRSVETAKKKALFFCYVNKRMMKNILQSFVDRVD